MSGDFDEKNDLNKLKKRNSNEKNKDAKKTFKISFDVEKFLDLKISELDVAGQLCQEVAPLATQLRTAERKQKEISRLFTECDEQLQQFQESLSLSPTPEEDCKSPVRRSVEEVIIDDSDEDDIVFIEATIPAVSRRKTPALFPSTAPSAVPTHSLLKPIATSYTGAVVYSARDASLESPPAGSSPKMIQLRAALTAKLNEQTGISPQHSGNSAVRKLNTQEMVGPPPSTKIVTPVMPKASSPTKPAPASAGVLINDTHYGGIKMTVGMKLLGKKFNDIWYKGTLTDIQHIGRPRDQQRYRVKFDGKGLKILTGRNLAYWETPENMIKVGSRVVAMYRDEDTTSSNSFYAGIVAEPLSVRNNHRLLVFFDDGYAQYCTPGEIHKVCEQSVEVWRDIHPDSQDFIREYLKQYPERPMVRLQKGQVVKTEWNGRWWTARVMEVDASLAKMFFDADKRTEWIYRGSTRLEPLYTALCKAAMASEQSGKARRNNPATMKGVKKPFVEYMRGAEEEKRSQMANAQLSSPIPTPAPTNKPALNRQVSNSSSSSNSSNKKRSVAKKSTGGKSQENEGNWEAPWLKRQRPKSCEGIQRQNRYQTSSISNQTVTPDMASVLQQRLAKCEDTDMDDEAQGERSDITNLPARDASRRKYEPHMCSRQCNEIMDDDPKVHRGSNPLLIPMLCGWERQITKTKPLSKRLVMYRAPCGRRFRNIDEVDKFLFDTDCSLTIDLFCFDPVLHTDKEFVPVKTFCDIKDLSYGKETVPISCVNGIDRQYPDYVEYSNQRTPCQGVSIPLDPNFLVCCDCTDGCQDKSKCACCQMTIEASGVTTGGRNDPSAGYQDRRLKEPLLTGIYECNSQCRCDSRCHNRVAQNGLALRLQVFKTENRGWGLRCLDDIPCGGFLCIYAGQLLTEQGANEDGQTYGDEYLAELDYMEVVERHKDGYESDVPESDRDDADEEEEDDDEDVKSHNSDSDFDGGELDNSKSDIQELRTLPARKRGSRMKNYCEQSSTTLGKLILRRDSGTQDEEWSIKHHDVASTPHKAADRLKEMSVKDALDGEIAPSGEEQQGDSDELPDVDPDSLSKKSSNAPKESRVKNLPDPSKSYIRAHRSMVSAHHKPSKEKLNDEKEEPIGTRHYFHDGQQCYVMDAKSMGNIGRYLNHSCSPNVFVQNVFVDTHDLRFPWVAFFAGKYIRQGTELTWDYNYEVGSVPGKILYCYCGSAECRGRLL